MSWDDARAALLLGVIVVNAVAALPGFPGLRRANFDHPSARDELGRISAVGADWGIEFDPDTLADALYTAADTHRRARAAVLRPLRPWFVYTGTGQSWGLFTYPDRFPSRLVVQGRTADGPWERLFVAHDSNTAFDEGAFTYRRVRAVYDGHADRSDRTWERFCTWAALRVFVARPDVVEVRVSTLELHTREPGEANAAVVEGVERGVQLRSRR